MKRGDLIKDLKGDYSELKNSLKLKSDYDSVEEAFHIEDYVQECGYVSTKLYRQISSRISETLAAWNAYLHGIIIPNPGNMVLTSESQIFNDEKKEEIIHLMNQIMSLVSLKTLNSLEGSRSKHAEFIDNSVKFWTEVLNPTLTDLMKNVNDYWLNANSQVPEKEVVTQY